MVKKIKNVLNNWLSVVLFVSGVVMLSFMGFLVNMLVGLGLSGLLLILMACILNHEEQKGGNE